MTRRRIVRSLLAGLAAMLVMAVVAPLAAARAGEPAIDTISVTKVDARDSDVELFLAGAVADVAPADIGLRSESEELEITGLASSQAVAHPTELVLIVDTNARSAQGEVLDRVKAQLIDEVGRLSDNTAVAVLSAGDSALVHTKLTTDKARIVAGIEALSAKNGSALYNALDRAGSVLSTEPGVIRSVLILSTGPDTGSEVTLDQAQVTVVQRGAQVISVRYDGGERNLRDTVSRTAGFELSVGSGAELESKVSEAVQLAVERLAVSFAGVADSGTRNNVTVTVGSASAEFSYPPEVLTDNPLQLVPVSVPEPTGLAFFRTSIGLYIALVLAFVGISLGVWSLGSIMAGGETTLEGMLSRYTDGTIDATDESEMEELIVQSAILQRAVSFSESFAEKRGFLARVEELLERANLPIRAGEAMFILVAIAVLSSGLSLVVTQSILGAVLFGAGSSGIAFFIVRFLGRRRFKAFESQLPDTLQLLSGTLRAGYSLPQGLEVVSKEIADPMGQELRRAMTEARLGRDLEECLGGVSERLSSADFAWTVMAISIQREVGGNLNELLMSVADTMIARERLKREIGALTAEGRMSAAVLSFLPPGLGLVMWIMNPDYVGLLFSEFLGNVMLGMGIVSALIGLAWMKKVITVDV